MGRINAASTLARLGDPEMEPFLEKAFREAEAGGQGAIAWSAIDVLANEYRSEFARRTCLKVGADLEHPFAVPALLVLSRVWLEDAEVRALLWKLVEAAKSPEVALNFLRRLKRVERARVADWVRSAIESGDLDRLAAAMRFAAAEPLPEAGPWLLRLARREDREPVRVQLYAALTTLRVDAVVPMMITDLNKAPSRDLRGAAASGLVSLGNAEGLEAVGGSLLGGDPIALELLVHFATQGGGAAVPDALVPALLDAVERLPGETERLSALYVLRCRGRLDDVKAGLVRAYEHEPSRRVARQIEKVLFELAHR